MTDHPPIYYIETLLALSWIAATRGNHDEAKMLSEISEHIRIESGHLRLAMDLLTMEMSHTKALLNDGAEIDKLSLN